MLRDLEILLPVGTVDLVFNTHLLWNEWGSWFNNENHSHDNYVYKYGKMLAWNLTLCIKMLFYME